MIAETFALILWVTARHRYNASDQPGRATYGPALWLGLAGAIIALLTYATFRTLHRGLWQTITRRACLGGPAYAGKGGMYRANRNVPYHL